jgi:hypothetical protein
VALRFTPARHRMLAEVSFRAGRGVGRMLRWYPSTRDLPELFRRPDGGDLTESERRAVMQFYATGLVDTLTEDVFVGRLVDVTNAGKRLLSEWNDKHGNPLTEESR